MLSNLARGNCEIEQKPISNPKSEISDWTDVQLQISDLGFKMQDSADFKIPSRRCSVSQVC